MPPTGHHSQLHIVYGIDQMVHAIDASGPITLQITQQGRGLANAFKGVAPGSIDQQVDSPEGLLTEIQPN